ncbi:MAG: RHS repeat-associated core domain-containing protein, partial [Kiritimatiellae bacterium]|nr:RHS repeat-associated core domain-containing protein [Kiritimatiellia bacterium]
EYDRDSGLYYYRTRYLDPEIGRFISRDPIGDIANPVSRRVRTEAMTVLYQMAMLQLILADNETLSTADRMGLVAGAVADLKLAGVVASGDPIFAIYIGGLNQYVFCGDNPVNFRDPLGLCGDGTSIRSMTGRESFRSWWSRNVQYPTYRVVEAVTWVFNPLDIPDFSEAGFQQQRYDALHYQGPVIGVPPSIMFRQVKPAQIDPSLIRKAKELFKNQTQPRLRSIVSEPPTIDMDTAPKGFWRNAFKAIGELLDNYMGEGPPPQ